MVSAGLYPGQPMSWTGFRDTHRTRGTHWRSRRKKASTGKPELTESWGGERWCLGCGGWRNHWLTGSWCPAPPLERPEIPTPVVRVWTAADGTVDQHCAPRDLSGPRRVLRSPLPAQPQAAGAHTDLLWAPGRRPRSNIMASSLRWQQLPR